MKSPAVGVAVVLALLLVTLGEARSSGGEGGADAGVQYASAVRGGDGGRKGGELGQAAAGAAHARKLLLDAVDLDHPAGSGKKEKEKAEGQKKPRPPPPEADGGEDGDGEEDDVEDEREREREERKREKKEKKHKSKDKHSHHHHHHHHHDGDHKHSHGNKGKERAGDDDAEEAAKPNPHTPPPLRPAPAKPDDAAKHSGAYYSAPAEGPKPPAAAAEGSRKPAPAGGGGGKPACPDVAHCSSVCMGIPHSHSMCSSLGGSGTYTAECCAGTGRVCPTPPCGQSSPKASESGASGAGLGGGRQALPSVPTLLGPHGPFGGPPRAPEGPSGPGGLLGGGHGPHSLLPMMGHLGRMLGGGGGGGIHPHVIHLPGLEPGGGTMDGCSHVTKVAAGSVQEGANMRDSVFLGSSNCYKVGVPQGADRVRIGLNPVSGGFFGGSVRGGFPVSLYASAGGWPKREEGNEVEMVEKDAGVRWARVPAGGGEAGGTLYVRVAAHESHGMAPLTYQIMFATPLHSRGPPAWYSPIEDVFEAHLARAVWVVYAILGAFVGLALSQQRVAVRDKSAPVAYVVWLTFGVFAAHRFYLGRTASGIIWYSLLVLLSTGLAMDFAFLRGPWSTYPHHHALWGALLAVIAGGMLYDLFMIPSMASDRGYWERSRRSRMRRRNSKGKKFETVWEDEAAEMADGEGDDVELGVAVPSDQGDEAGGGALAEAHAVSGGAAAHSSAGLTARRGGGQAGVGPKYQIKWSEGGDHPPPPPPPEQPPPPPPVGGMGAPNGAPNGVGAHREGADPQH